jgi:hypothetical protein
MAKKKQFFDLNQSRYGLFMNDPSFDLDIFYGRNYLVSDVVHEVTVHRINVLETKSHSLYGQSKSKDKKFFPPVKINVMPLVENSEDKYYGEEKGGIVRSDTGNLSIGIYLQELEEKKIEINRGDYLEYNMSGEKKRYYEVEFAQNVVDETAQTIAGFKPYWKKVVGVPVKEDVLPYLSETGADSV